MSLPTLTLSAVTLNVQHLSEMAHYYQHTIGLTVRQQSATTIDLGTTDQTLLKLQYHPDLARKTNQSGLYHTAFLLPTRQALGDFLKHILTEKIPVDGASDHGYSEAIYLTDPEGNGIEVYRDKPVTDWDIREDGRIVGVTEPLDAHGVLASAQDTAYALPVDTQIGHVHLQVHDLQETSRFYQNVLGFTSKDAAIPQADFLAQGQYHHHIAVNTWSLTPLSVRQPALGLAQYSFAVANKLDLAQVIAQLKAHNVAFTPANNSATFQDPSGIVIMIFISASAEK